MPVVLKKGKSDIQTLKSDEYDLSGITGARLSVMGIELDCLVSTMPLYSLPLRSNERLPKSFSRSYRTPA
mgnify:CR=1 FL=1